MATLKEKIGYALGDAAAGGITWKVMSIAFPLFFTNVFGLTVADTATLMLIARMFDVVTDPMMGALADRTQSRWGTYRPWLILGAVPFGLIFALLLYTPEFGPVGKRIWAYTLYLLMMVIYTAVNVPYGSLLGVMTDNDDEKNQFSSFRMVGAYAMGFITLLSFPYLQKLVGGTDQHQYAVLGAFFGIIAAAGTLACGLLTKERLKPVRAEKFSFKPFGDLFRNRPWIILTLVGICTNFFNGFRYAVAGYMFEYCMHGDVTVSGLIINYTVFMTFGELTCMVFGGVSPVFTRMVGSKRKAFMWAAVICAVTSIGFFFVPMDPAYIWVMVAVVILTLVGICTNFFNGFRYAVAGYMFEYCMHGDVTVSGLIINYTVFMTFGELTCMVFGGVSPVFTKWVGSKRRAFMWAAVICAVTSIGFFFVPMDPAYIWVMVAVVILTSIGIGIYSPLLWSMYADVSDYATEKNGTSSTGLIFSSGTMAQKFGSAISGALVAALLGLAGFISGSDPATGQTVVTITNEPAVCKMIWSLFSIFPAVFALLIVLLLHLYPIKK